jgi:hypothetical protein
MGPQIVNCMDGCQIWIVGIMYNKQLWTTDKDGPLAWCLDEGLTTLYCYQKQQLSTKWHKGV